MEINFAVKNGGKKCSELIFATVNDFEIFRYLCSAVFENLYNNILLFFALCGWYFFSEFCLFFHVSLLFKETQRKRASLFFPLNETGI